MNRPQLLFRRLVESQRGGRDVAPAKEGVHVRGFGA